jgi:hypothetical protein
MSRVLSDKEDWIPFISSWPPRNPNVHGAAHIVFGLQPNVTEPPDDVFKPCRNVLKPHHNGLKPWNNVAAPLPPVFKPRHNGLKPANYVLDSGDNGLTPLHMGPGLDYMAPSARNNGVLALDNVAARAVRASPLTLLEGSK